LRRARSSAIPKNPAATNATAPLPGSLAEAAQPPRTMGDPPLYDAPPSPVAPLDPVDPTAPLDPLDPLDPIAPLDPLEHGHA
jgi:hypothetical protein